MEQLHWLKYSKKWFFLFLVPHIWDRPKSGTQRCLAQLYHSLLSSSKYIPTRWISNGRLPLKNCAYTSVITKVNRIWQEIECSEHKHTSQRSAKIRVNSNMIGSRSRPELSRGQIPCTATNIKSHWEDRPLLLAGETRYTGISIHEGLKFSSVWITNSQFRSPVPLTFRRYTHDCYVDTSWSETVRKVHTRFIVQPRQ